jgi:hypothetical protein
MMQYFPKVVVGVVVETDLDNVEVENGANKGVIVAGVPLVTEDIDVDGLVITDFVEVVNMVEEVDAIIG